MQKVQFKQYNEGEILLFPDRLDLTISDNHLVRVVNHTVNQLDLTFLLSTYCGGGTTAYHPRMLLKVLLYAYCLKLYTGRKIANALRSDITFMWLSGKQYPDFRTINNFRSGRLKDSIHTVFASLLLLLFNEGYIRLEEYYCDGTTIQADANKHKVVWKKNPSRYLEGVEARIDSTLLEIDKLVKEENEQYGEDDLELLGKSDAGRKDRIEESISQLNAIINKDKTPKSKKSRAASRLKNELEEAGLRKRIYEEQKQICGDRSGYSRTDPQATPMRTKECQRNPIFYGDRGIFDLHTSLILKINLFNHAFVNFTFFHLRSLCYLFLSDSSPADTFLFLIHQHFCETSVLSLIENMEVHFLHLHAIHLCHVLRPLQQVLRPVRNRYDYSSVSLSSSSSSSK